MNMAHTPVGKQVIGIWYTPRERVMPKLVNGLIGFAFGYLIAIVINFVK